jgi:hypothetical protein
VAQEVYIGPERDDVQHRLVKSICRYKDLPVYVNSSKLHVVSIIYLHDSTKAMVDYRDAEFDYRSPPLGYMNVNEEAHYLVREPDRKNQKYGLTPGTVACPAGTLHPQDYFLSKAMAACIMANHPTFREVVEKLDNDDIRSSAIARHVALSKLNNSTLTIMYRGRMVGTRELGVWRLLNSMDASIIKPYIERAGVPL